MGATKTIAVSKTSVDARVKDWIKRLNALYGQIDQWVKAVPGTAVKRETLPQVTEPLMKRFGVGPRDIPTYTVFRGKRRIAFVPSALWIVGANGRVDVTTSSRQHLLVDMGGQGVQPSDWQLVLADDRNSLRPFDHQAFLDLLEEGR